MFDLHFHDNFFKIFKFQPCYIQKTRGMCWCLTSQNIYPDIFAILNWTIIDVQ
jgi:hypothetical protein